MTKREEIVAEFLYEQQKENSLKWIDLIETAHKISPQITVDILRRHISQTIELFTNKSMSYRNLSEKSRQFQINKAQQLLKLLDDMQKDGSK